MNLLKKYFSFYFPIGLFYGVILTLVRIVIAFFDIGVQSIDEMTTFSMKLFLSLAVVLSILAFYFKEVYSPKKKISILQENQFNKFYQRGFVLKEAQLTGIIKGYNCTIFFVESSPVNSRSYALIFKISCDLRREEIKNLTSWTNDNCLIWEDNYVSKVFEFSFFFTTPSEKQMIQSLNQTIKILIENKINPQLDE